MGRRYWLKLCIDPPRLPRVVPVAPDFSSRPHGGFPPCEAHQSGPSYTFAGVPRWGFSPLRLRQGSAGFSALAHPPLARFRVAQSHPVGCGLGRTGHCSPERPSQPYEPNYGHTATAHAQPGLVIPTWSGG